MALNATVSKILSDFRTIESSAMGQAARLKGKDSWSSQTKATKIEDAVHRLALLIMERHNLHGLARGHSTTRLDPDQVRSMQDGHLDGLEAMFLCKVRVLKRWTSYGDSTYGDHDVDHENYLPQTSIRDALNASTNNIFFWIEPSLGPLWGKADALIQVENEIFPGRV